jgi:hypothetical protein
MTYALGRWARSSKEDIRGEKALVLGLYGTRSPPLGLMPPAARLLKDIGGAKSVGE